MLPKNYHTVPLRARGGRRRRTHVKLSQDNNPTRGASGALERNLGEDVVRPEGDCREPIGAKPACSKSDSARSSSRETAARAPSGARSRTASFIHDRDSSRRARTARHTRTAFPHTRAPTTPYTRSVTTAKPTANLRSSPLHLIHVRHGSPRAVDRLLRPCKHRARAGAARGREASSGENQLERLASSRCHVHTPKIRQRPERQDGGASRPFTCARK